MKSITICKLKPENKAILKKSSNLDSTKYLKWITYLRQILRFLCKPQKNMSGSKVFCDAG